MVRSPQGSVSPNQSYTVFHHDLDVPIFLNNVVGGCSTQMHVLKYNNTRFEIEDYFNGKA
jgi:hypothetical protein